MPESNLTPIDEQETVPETPLGCDPWREYSVPGGRAVKAGAYLTTTLAGGLLFAFVLGVVPNVQTITIPTFSTGTAVAIALTILVVLVVVHEGFHGLAGWLIGADVSFRLGNGGFQTVLRHAVQTRRETLAYYLLPLVVATPVWFALLIAAGYLRVPLVLAAAYFAVAVNVAGSALDVYYAWGISRLPRGTRIYTTEYRMLVALPSSAENPPEQ